MLESAGIPRPVSNIAWAGNGVPGRGALASGFTYHKHGFGCAVNGPAWAVDFDFGDEGQMDGFDAWRLHRFARRRLPEYGFTSEKDIEAALNEAERSGELRFSGYILFYVTDAGRMSISEAAGQQDVPPAPLHDERFAPGESDNDAG